MPAKLLIDTDVLIDYLRDLEAAVSSIESLLPPLLISAISGLVTLNRKHFPMLASITVPYQKG